MDGIMAAPKGNQFWKMKSSFGRKPIFANPENMLAAAFEYFQWCDDNPLIEQKLCQELGEYVLKDLPRKRPYTLGALRLFLDLGLQTWYEYKKRNEFIEVTETIDDCIREQKFAGAAAGFFNANIIARDLGLKDSTEVEHKGGVTLTFDKDDENV